MESKVSFLLLEETTTRIQQFCNKKLKVLMTAALVLCVMTCAAVTAVVMFISQARGKNLHLPKIDLPAKESFYFKMIQKRNSEINREAITGSCYSNMSDDSLPVAKISARGTRWGTTEIMIGNGQLDYNYRGKWSCSTSHGNSFVRGGMYFNQDDQRLYFPKCGYYYISSQVVFQYSSEKNRDYFAQHGIDIRPNCAEFESDFQYAHSSIIKNNSVRTSTYIGDILHMCAGGSISVIIPAAENTCCARGEADRTHFSAFLVQETSCP